MDMSQHRADKIAELRADAQTHADRAAALTALAALILHGDMPVERWRVYWRGVADDCRRQARGANAYAAELRDRADTVAMAANARANYDAMDIDTT